MQSSLSPLSAVLKQSRPESSDLCVEVEDAKVTTEAPDEAVREDESPEKLMSIPSVSTSDESSTHSNTPLQSCRG